MALAAQLLLFLLVALHAYFLVLEMFLWATPFGAKTFQRPLEEMMASQSLAQNQGLYNGFLAAGLAWSALASDAGKAFELRLFFVGCVVVAGIVGGFTAARKIFFVQALPGLVTLAVVLLGPR